MQTAATVEKGSQRNAGISTMTEAVQMVFDNTDLLLECLSFIGWDRHDVLLWVRTCSSWRRCIFAEKSPVWKHLTAVFNFRKLELQRLSMSPGCEYYDSRLRCKRFTFGNVNSLNSSRKLVALTTWISQIRAASTTVLVQVPSLEETTGRRTDGQRREKVEWVGEEGCRSGSGSGGVGSGSGGGVEGGSGREREGSSERIVEQKVAVEERKKQEDQGGTRVEIEFLRLVNVDVEIAAYLLEQFQVTDETELSGEGSRWHHRRCLQGNLPAFLSAFRSGSLPLFQADGGAHVKALSFCGTGHAFPWESDAAIFQDIVSLPRTLKSLTISKFRVGDGYGLAQAVSDLPHLEHVSISDWPHLRATSLLKLTQLTRLHLHQIAMDPEEVQALLDQLNLLQDLEIGNSVPEHLHSFWCRNSGPLDPVRLSFLGLLFLKRLVLKFCCCSAVFVEMELPPQLESYSFHPGVVTETNCEHTGSCPSVGCPVPAGTRFRRPTGDPTSTFRVLWKVDLSWRCRSALCWTCSMRRGSAIQRQQRLGRLIVSGAQVPPDFRQFVGPGQFIYNATV